MYLVLLLFIVHPLLTDYFMHELYLFLMLVYSLCSFVTVSYIYLLAVILTLPFIIVVDSCLNLLLLS